MLKQRLRGNLLQQGNKVFTQPLQMTSIHIQMLFNLKFKTHMLKVKQSALSSAKDNSTHTTNSEISQSKHFLCHAPIQLCRCYNKKYKSFATFENHINTLAPCSH